MNNQENIKQNGENSWMKKKKIGMIRKNIIKKRWKKKSKFGMIRKKYNMVSKWKSEYFICSKFMSQ